MEQVAVVSYWLSLALLVAATVLYSYQFLMRRQSIGGWARFSTGAAFISLTAAIGLRSAALDESMIVGPYNQLILVAWALLMLYFVLEHLIKVKIYGTFLVPAALVMLVIAQFLQGAASTGLSDEALRQLDNWRVGIHVGLIVFANAGFLIGGAASVLYLVLDSQLKHHRTSVFFRRMPSLAQAQTIARRTIALAFPIYTAGMVLGVIRAIETDVAGFWADARVIMAGLVWFVFGTYLLLLYRHGISSRSASWIAVIGVVVVIVLAIVARTLPVGFHVFGL